MNKKGNVLDKFKTIRSTIKRIKKSYVYRLFSKILSFIFTTILVLLLIVGALMFYFNLKAKNAEEQGVNYTPPFGLYTVISGSMEPNIHVYDVVVSAQVEDLSTIKVGDIITFISTWEVNYGRTVTHRVASVTKTETGEYQFTTKGDNNQSADGAVVTQSNLVGKVYLRLPQLGKVQFFLATKSGWFIAVFIPALAIIIYDMLKIFKLNILKKKIEDVSDTEKANKIYYENDILDNRYLNDSKLEKTVRLDVLEIEETIKMPVMKEMPKVTIAEEKVSKNINYDKKPISKREKKEEYALITGEYDNSIPKRNETDSKQINDKKPRKLIKKRKL